MLRTACPAGDNSFHQGQVRFRCQQPLAWQLGGAVIPVEVVQRGVQGTAITITGGGIHSSISNSLSQMSKKMDPATVIQYLREFFTGPFHIDDPFVGCEFLDASRRLFSFPPAVEADKDIAFDTNQ